MSKITIFEFLEMFYMSWDFWVGGIIGAMLGFAFCKLTTFKELTRKDSEVIAKNDELEQYHNEIQALKKEISELKIGNAMSEYYAKRDKG